MTEAEIRGLCLKSREIFLSQPILLELEAPLKICGRSLFATINGYDFSVGEIRVDIGCLQGDITHIAQAYIS